MAQGSKYTDEQKEQAIALLTVKNIKEVSKELNIPQGTLKDWQKKESEINPRFNELRLKKKEEFVEQAWNIIGKANRLLEKKIDRALVIEEKLEDVLEKARNNEDLKTEDVAFLVKNMGKLGMENIGQLSTMIGTLYDKQALIHKESTINVGADASLEETLRNLQGEEM